MKKDINEGIYKRTKGMINKLDNAADILDKKAPEMAADYDKIKASVKNVSDKIPNAKKMAKRGAIGVGALLAVVTINKVYRKYRYGSCRKLSGRELNDCLISSIDKTIDYVKSFRLKCQKTDDPKLCREKLEQRLKELSEKRDKLIKKQF